MKTLRLPLLVILASLFITSGCQRSGRQDTLDPAKSIEEPFSSPSSDRAPTGGGTCNPNAFIITLESKTLVNGYWVWIWSVQNSNPGNGYNGTIQDLSHWGMQFGTCFLFQDVVAAAYSSNNISWTSFTPTYEIDPSQTCMTTPLLKFDYGTTGSAKSYYKLVVNKNLPIGWVPGYYKSGAVTGCCIFNFMGIACPGVQEEKM